MILYEKEVTVISFEKFRNTNQEPVQNEAHQQADVLVGSQSRVSSLRNSRLFQGMAILLVANTLGGNASQATEVEEPVREPGITAVTGTTDATDSKSSNTQGYNMRKMSGAHGGVWSFFGDPRSIRVNDKIYTGWANERGNTQIAQYDTETNKKKVVTLGPNLGRPDDHNNPSLIARKDGRIMAFYSPHSGRSLPKHGVSRMYYRTTKKPEDISKWGATHRVPTNTGNNKLGYTYPNPVKIDRGKIFLGWRGGNWQPTASITPDHGKSWTRARTFLKASGARRPYVKYSGGPDGSVNMTYNQDNPGTRGVGIYNMQYRPGHGYYKANGEKIANSRSAIPFSRGDMIMSKNRHGRLYVMDTATDKNGNPAAVFTGKRNGEDASMFYSRWDGKHWKTEHMVDTGYELYDKTKPHHYGFYPTAGMSLDHKDPSTVYLSRQVDHQMRVEKWEHKAPGKWTHESVSPRNKSCVRPASVRDGKPGEVAMMCGDYKDWLKFNTDIYLATPKEAQK